MELVTGAMGSLLPKLGQLLKEEYGLQKGVKKKIESLSHELEAAHAVLHKIGDVPPDQLDELVRLWASEVREASYDMEDIVDTFLVRVDATEPTEPHVLRRLRKKVGKLWKKSKARHNISSLIEDINKKLEEVDARRGRYTLNSIVANPVAANTIDPRLRNMYKKATELIGIKEPRDKLIDMLSLDGDVDVSEQKMKIVSVVGCGGLGKTTLAKAVYDHLKPHFECGAFVPVGRNPDIKKVFRDILIALDKETYTYSKLNGLDEKQLMDELNAFVKKKRFFIVIDDIWDKESWKLLRCALQESNYGSRLVVTTRISEVATYAGEAYKIQPLSHDNSKSLLYARITDGEGKCFDSPMVEACEKILRKCGGVPLSIITIASLLASKPREDWYGVYNSIGFGHDYNDDVGNARKILSFSYYDLPSHLKACLLYLSMFPEEYVIDKNNLIWMWIAEGFISKEQAAQIGLFEFGERCFNELINRSMIQPVENEYRGYVDACTVHDIVLDLIHHLSSRENFFTVWNGSERQELPGSIFRRLALHHVEEHNGDRNLLLTNRAMEKVRSLYSSECHFGALCPRLQFLHVVYMNRCQVQEDHDESKLDHLRSLLHLRYLRVAYTHITEMPREIRYLKFLQTLDLRDSDIKELPEEVGLLTQLVCLRAGRVTRVPAGLIGKLTSLQELWVEPPNATIQLVKELDLLRELRVLRTEIEFMNDSMENAFLDSLSYLRNNEELHIWGSALDKGGVSGAAAGAGAGSISYRHLRRLHFKCFSRLPSWIKTLLTPNLSFLYAEVLVVKQQDMETLARLPQLSCLILRSSESDTELVNIKIVRTDEGVGYFRKLTTLKISGPSVWFDLRGIDSECNSSGSSRTASIIMPSLEHLEFDVHVRFLKDASQLGFQMPLGFQNLARTSLQRVRVILKCGGAPISEVEKAEAALGNAAVVHPKHPTLETTWADEEDMLSPYQEKCKDVSRTTQCLNKAWNLTNSSGHIRALPTPDPAASSSKVIRLLYLNYGRELLALCSNAVHKLWKWERVSTTSVPPQLWKPANGSVMTNDITNGSSEEATACFALYQGDFLFSTSGGSISSFYVPAFVNINTIIPVPPAATFLAVLPAPPASPFHAFFLPRNRILAIGMEDSSIQILDIPTGEVNTVLMGHQKKITGLAFSELINVLVSSGADAQLCLWDMDSWEEKKSRYIESPSNLSGTLVGDTSVQFHYDETHILVVHETQLSIYDSQLECLYSWFPRDELPAPVSSAVYSSDGLLVYAGFCDGAIGIFEAESLVLRCRIAPSSYIPSSISSGGGIVYPMVVAAHPWKPNQIAVGMSDGAVHVLEPPLDTDDIQVGE